MKNLPSGLFNTEFNVTPGDTAMAIVTVVSALGIAWVVDQQKNHGFDELQEKINKYEHLDFNSLVQEYDQIVLEVAHVKTHSEQEQFITKELEEWLPINHHEATLFSKILDRVFGSFFPETDLKVGDLHPARYQRIDEFYDMWKFINGFKDGVVRVTGPGSLFAQCNGNITETNGIFYFQFFDLFGPDTVYDNFAVTDNRNNSLRAFLNGLKKIMQWPFLTLNSCYWAMVLLYEPNYGHDFPNFLNIRDDGDNSWIKYDVYA